MFLRFFMMLTSANMMLARSSRSSVRLGKSRLLQELRTRSAFTDKCSPAGDNNTVHITFMYQHYEVLMVDEVEQSVTSIGYVNITWKDPDLTWNNSDFAGVDVIKVERHEIWHPTIIVTNSFDPDLLTIDKIDTVRIMASGLINYMTPVYLKTGCDMDMRNYPFDSQICPIIFMPFLDDVQYIITTENRDQYHHHFSVSGQWRMGPHNIHAYRVEYFNSYSEIVKFTMQINRVPLYYVLCLMTPMVVTYSVTSLVFWIPPSSGEKISFVVTIFVSNVLFLNFIAGTMPRNISSIPRLTFFMIMINCQCLFAIIATIVVVWKHQKELVESAHERGPNLPPNDEKVKSASHNISSSTGTKQQLSIAGKVSTLKSLGFSSLKIQPFEATWVAGKQVIGKRSKRCWLPSRRYDAIFFCVFHLLSIPFICLMFVI